jgi:hypothetical protein
MKKQWERQMIKLTVWVFTEVLLNLVGLDNLADYSEFLGDRREITLLPNGMVQAVVVTIANLRDSSFFFTATLGAIAPSLR